MSPQSKSMRIQVVPSATASSRASASAAGDIPDSVSPKDTPKGRSRAAGGGAGLEVVVVVDGSLVRGEAGRSIRSGDTLTAGTSGRPGPSRSGETLEAG